MWLALLPLFFPIQDPREEPYRIEANLEVAIKEEGSHVFAIRGTTDLPDHAILQIDLFRAETTEGMGFQSKRIRVRDGAFRVEIKVFPAEIPPGKYVARVWFHPHLQDESVHERARIDGRDLSEARVVARLQVGTFETFSAARKAHMERIAEELDSIVGLLANSVETQGDRRARAIEAAHHAMDRVMRRGEAQAVLDFHYGVLELSQRLSAQIANFAKAALRDLSSGAIEEAATQVRLAQECAREARMRLGLPLPPANTVVEMVRELALILRVLVEERRGAQPQVNSPSFFEPHLEPRRGQISHLILRIAAGLGPNRYEEVEALSRESDRLLAALLKPGDTAYEIASIWTNMERLLQQLIGQ